MSVIISYPTSVGGIRELKQEDFSRRRRGEVREGPGLTSSFSSQIFKFVKHWCYTTWRPPFSDPSLFDPFESVMARVKEFCQILLLLQCQSNF